jgi:hypothetical protein
MNSIGKSCFKGPHVERDHRSRPKAWVIEFVATSTTKKRGLWGKAAEVFIQVALFSWADLIGCVGNVSEELDFSFHYNVRILSEISLASLLQMLEAGHS